MTASLHRRRDWIFVLALTALYLGLAFCWQDISYFDETFYMQSGTMFRFSTLITHLQFAPLYAMWYRLLQLICPWPVWRYFLSWATLVALTLLLPVWMRLRSAWVYTWLLVCVPFLGPSSFAINPYVNLFAACLLLGGASFIRARGLTTRQAAFVAFLACFTVSFARPEFAFFVPVAAIVYLVLHRVSSSLHAEKHARLQLYVVLALTLLMLVILRHGGGSRSGIAFAQHFNVRAAQNHLIPPGQDPWTSEYATRAFHIDPGTTAATTTATIFGFMKANPRLFAGHVLANLLTTTTWVSCVILLLVLSAPFWPTNFAREHPRQLRSAALYLGLVCLPPLTSILLIFPDERYFFTLLPAALLCITELLGAGRAGARWQPWLFAAALPIILLTTVGWAPLKYRQVPLPHPVRDTVACLRTLQHRPGAPSGLVFDSVGIAPVMLGSSHPHIQMWDVIGWANFQAWVQYNRPAWVEVSPSVTSFYGVSAADMDTYLRGRGYTPYACPAVPAYTPLQVYIAGK